ncbi:EH signature domain-containing protein [Microbacterium sp.]|uniref:EH signature domain-containing protein n=1 Tax=Microbacterium sp. TaxID=51671 RepID=UPI003C78BB17
MVALIDGARMARALAWLWVETDGDCRDTVSTLLLDAVAAHTPSRATLHFLARLYFERFDTLDAPGGRTRRSVLQKLQDTLRTGALEFGDSAPETAGIVPSLSTHAETLLARSAPEKFAHESYAAGRQYEAAVRFFGTDGFMSGRFGELVRQYLVLEQLKTIPMDDAGPLLTELRSPVLHNAAHIGGHLFGHAALSVMIDRAGEASPPADWQQAVLDIASDPRRVNSDDFRKWWSKLGPVRVRTVTRWIAVDELALFLDSLKSFAAETGNDDMTRMFLPRKKFLEGLLMDGHVESSRLFLGGRARSAVQRRGRSLLSIPLLEGNGVSERALIYLDCGDFHMIEGTHNTKLWAYLLEPPSYVTDWHRYSYTYASLTAGMAEAFDKQHGAPGPLNRNDFVHRAHWQDRVLGYLARHLIHVNPETVLERHDYSRFRRTPEYAMMAALSYDSAARTSKDIK